ncbi:MAG: nucleotidyltransferase family protein [Deltaproteobacteria bacterium]|nr:nucleotidyltransferase family protein [Deltaproteobacteria bacterium]MBI2341466.1 nucleotidyltransferase family protein [Deltaproteobacteria bacterium]MBI2974702.1 nucleotidyltransferase family protein [Deltaproteobacteria bacterium]
MKRVPAIILSAGESKRMGFPKALLRIGKTTLLEDQMRRFKKAGCHPVVPVLGANAKTILNNAHGIRKNYVINRRWKLGQFSSVKSGLKSLKDISFGCFIIPVDAALVPVKIIRKIARKSLKNRHQAIIPSYKGQLGHPVWISQALIKKIRSEDAGKNRLDKIIRRQRDKLIIKTNTAAILTNVNTPEKWKQAIINLSSP